MKPTTITFTIEGKEITYTLKQSFRSLLEFEKRTGKSAFEANADLTDSIMFFYCAMLSSNPGSFTLSFDEFIDYLDSSPETFQTFQSYILSEAGLETAKADKKKVEKR